jgi:lysophospholipase L1-like esterase
MHQKRGLKRARSESGQNAGCLCEPLESRRLLSVVFRGGIGVVGDSDSDEYAFASPHRWWAKNYVELLAQLRGLNFGGYSTAKRAAPQYAGYAFDWAKSGDTSSQMIADGQVAGLAAQAAAHKVSVAIVFIGANDLHGALKAGNPQASLQAAEQRLVNNITSTVQTLRNAWSKLKIVVATEPDLGLLPGIKAEHHPASVLKQLTAVTNQVNTQIRALAAANPLVAVTDVAAQVQRMTATSSIKIGGLTIDTRTTGDSAGHLFLADGMHYGTALQARLANRFVQTLDRAFGLNIQPLTNAEIARAATT